MFLHADGPSGSQLCGNGSEHVGGVLGQSRALLGDPEGICKDTAGEQIPQTFLPSLSPAAVPQKVHSEGELFLGLSWVWLMAEEKAEEKGKP